MAEIKLSPLKHTWIFDLDGTLFKHNGYKGLGDEVLPGVVDFWNSIPNGDMVILLTARSVEESSTTLITLTRNNLRYDHIIFDVPKGERLIFNDIKPGGLHTAHSFNLERDSGLLEYSISTVNI